MFQHLQPLTLALVLDMTMAWSHLSAGDLKPEYLGTSKSHQ